MRKTILVLLLWLGGTAAYGQTPGNTTGQGYAFIGPGSVQGSTLLNFGGGGEVTYKGAGVAAEIGMMAPTAAFTDGYWGAFSLNGIYHFPVKQERGYGFSPFVTGGYTLFFREGSANLWNVGGGVDYWVTRRVGFRAEFRDHIYSQTYSRYGATHFWNIRGGVVLR